jgi:non-heme chloroperoxidase
MLKTASNPDGLPIAVFDGFRRTCRQSRPVLHRRRAGPFYGFNRPDAKVSQGVIDNWWRQGMMGSAKAHYDGIKAFSETDQTEDLKAITVPTLVTQGDDDQIVPFKDAAEAAGQAAEEQHAQDLQGLPARDADHPCRRDQSPDLLAFIKA